MVEKSVHSFEAGRRAKPDEREDQLAGIIGAYFLERFPKARFDLRVQGTWNDHPLIRIGGEVSQEALAGGFAGLDERVRSAYETIHNEPADEVNIEYNFKPQATPLAQNGHAGDSGHAIAVAYADGPNHLPWERYLSVGIRDLLDAIYRNEGRVPDGLGMQELKGLAEDGKIQVDASYRGSRLESIDRIIIAAAQQPQLDVETLRASLSTIVQAYLNKEEEKYEVQLGEPALYINGAGNWYRKDSGAKADAGNREAKPHRHAFSTYGVATDALTGEDPSKPDLTATLLARYIAVQVVDHGLAEFARVSLSYIIGHEELHLNVTTNGEGNQEDIERWVKENVPLSLSYARKQFGLRDPDLYRQIVHDADLFQNPEYEWNRVNL